MLLAITCNYGWSVLQLDLKVAFLQAKLEDDVHVKVAPRRYERDKDEEVLCYKLIKCLYGLPVSPNLWYGVIDKSLKVGFIVTKLDPYVCIYVSDDTLVIHALCVDEILPTRRKSALVKNIKLKLIARVSMTDLGEAGLVLGMTVMRDYERRGTDHLTGPRTWRPSLSVTVCWNAIPYTRRNRCQRSAPSSRKRSLLTPRETYSIISRSWGRSNTSRRPCTSTSATPSNNYHTWVRNRLRCIWGPPSTHCDSSSGPWRRPSRTRRVNTS